MSGERGRPHESPRHGMFAGGRMLGQPVAKAKDLKGTALRLAAYLKPYRARLILMFV